MNEFPIDEYIGISQTRNNFPEKYEKIIEFNKNFDDIHWGQKLYNYHNNLIELPKCRCGNSVKFYKYNMGYAKYCSGNCRYNDEDLKNKIKKSFLEKYGVENPLQSSIIQNKRKKIFLEKYGVEHQSQLTKVKEKRKQTNIERYGVTTNLLDKDVKEKIKQTNLKKFGVEHNSQSEIIKEKKRKTNLEKYDVSCNFKSDIFKKQSQITTLKKYGVKHSSLSSEIRKKQINKKRLNKINEIAKKLNIDFKNISISNEFLTIKNYCNKHDSFNISTNLFHQRWFKYDKKICTKCYPQQKQNSGCEIEIKNYIDSLKICQNNNNKKILKDGFEIDIYLPDYKLGIEFDGLYWHSDIYKDKKYHLNKTNECEKQGIQLLHVFEDEWINKKDIVKSIIKSKLGLIENKIFGRKCEVREIDHKTSLDFLNKNHLQGGINSKIKLGLYYNDELISIMTLGKKRIALGNKEKNENEYELLRFCNKLNTQVMGGASRLLNYFIKTYNPKSIITYADKRYSNGNLYKQLGFKFIGNTEPNYWYFKSNELIRHYRFGFRKDILVKEGYDSNKTEEEIMRERKYFRIYDCGNMKFKLNIEQ